MSFTREHWIKIENKMEVGRRNEEKENEVKMLKLKPVIKEPLRKNAFFFVRNVHSKIDRQTSDTYRCIKYTTESEWMGWCWLSKWVSASDQCKWSEPTFRFKTKIYTHKYTYHKCLQHLSSSSAVETNREYLIRKEWRRRRGSDAQIQTKRSYRWRQLKIRYDLRNMNKYTS